MRPVECKMMVKTFAVLAWALPVVCSAATDFAGTWVIQPQLTQFELRPLSVTLDRGVYQRTSCVPSPEVPADGQEHPIIGDPLVQSMSVHVLDASRVVVTQRLAGQIVWQGRYTVAPDQKSMTLAYEDHRARLPVSATVQFARAAGIEPHAHGLSGTWQAVRLLTLSPSGLTMTLQDTDHGLQMTAGDGRGYDISFDRKDYPLRGYLEGATVQVGLRTPRTLQVNRKQQGLLVEMSIGQLADDGQSMKLGQVDWQCQSKVAWTLRRQSPPAQPLP